MSPSLTRIPRRRGLTLPEALISLSICATLLTAMGTAFVATAKTMTANNDFSSATQVARSSIFRIEREVRQGVPGATGRTGNIATGITVIDSLTGVTSTYAYNSATQTLTVATTGTAKTLATNISTCKFIITDGTNSAGQSCISQVGILLTATVGKNTITLSGSATPRRNLPTTMPGAAPS